MMKMDFKKWKRKRTEEQNSLMRGIKNEFSYTVRPHYKIHQILNIPQFNIRFKIWLAIELGASYMTYL